jgi:hypothetical protein
MSEPRYFEEKANLSIRRDLQGNFQVLSVSDNPLKVDRQQVYKKQVPLGMKIILYVDVEGKITDTHIFKINPPEEF